MRLRGVCYDVGTQSADRTPSRPDFDRAVVRRELEVIRRELHCSAVRISGGDLERLAYAAEAAAAVGLGVWLSPALHDASPAQTLAHLHAVARIAEALRSRAPEVVLVVGCELTLFMRGLVRGATSAQRLQAFVQPWRLLTSALRHGPFNWRLNRFLRRAAREARREFGGPLSYASGVWEDVNWSGFDFVGVDCYRDAAARPHYRERLRAYAAHGKPLVVTEFGCCTYEGAEDKGGYGWAIADHTASPPRLRGAYTRSEAVQARELLEQFDVFCAEGVAGAFAFTFVMPKYPHAADPRFDLDMASYALVKTLPGRCGSAYPDLPWEPKLAFAALAARYARCAAAQ